MQNIFVAAPSLAALFSCPVISTNDQVIIHEPVGVFQASVNLLSEEFSEVRQLVPTFKFSW
jgi:hypothetical protein